MRDAARVLVLVLTGCVESLEAPALPDLVSCETDDDETRFFSMFGNMSGFAVTVSDPDAPLASLHIDTADTPGLAELEVISTAAEASYVFEIEAFVGEGRFELGPPPPRGVPFAWIVLKLEVERPGFGRIQLNSLSGTLSVLELGRGRWGGSFRGDFGAPGDRFVGCFDLEIDDEAP